MSAATLRRVVVVGNGMTGIRFVQELVQRDLDRRLDVTVVGDEPGGAYNRMQLSNVLAGSAREDAVTLAGFDWYAANGVRLHAGRSATAIDRRCRAVALDDGTSLPYDELVLATGSEAVLPPIEGLLRDGDLVPGAVLFRTLDDCMRIDRLARTAHRAVVLGAGVLGLEAARALAGRGLHVTLVQRGARLMERQLDADAARVLSRTLRDLGIAVVTGAEVARVDAGRSLEAVALADGRVLPAELLAICCGVRPRVSLAAGAGLSVGRGVVVDDELRSVSDARVRAIGECAEHRGECVGLVAPCWDQARVAAQLSVDPSATIRYTATPVVTRLKARGIELATMGESVGQDDEADDIVRFSDSGRGVYQKLVVRDGRLVGAILLGDTRTVGTVTQLYGRGTELPTDRASVLMARRNAPASTAATPTALPARTTVCQCNGVTKGAITAAWTDGARSVEAIAARTRATTGCGTCRDTVCGLVDWLASSDPDPVEPTTALSAASLTALSPH